MDRHLIPFLQAAISQHRKSVISLIVKEYSFEFRHQFDHCDVEVCFDFNNCVILRQKYQGKDFEESDISLEGFVKYIS